MEIDIITYKIDIKSGKKVNILQSLQILVLIL